MSGAAGGGRVGARRDRPVDAADDRRGARLADRSRPVARIVSLLHSIPGTSLPKIVTKELTMFASPSHRLVSPPLTLSAHVLYVGQVVPWAAAKLPH